MDIYPDIIRFLSSELNFWLSGIPSTFNLNVSVEPTYLTDHLRVKLLVLTFGLASFIQKLDYTHMQEWHLKPNKYNTST